MKKYDVADVRYNNGRGALLCNRCSIIIDYGFEHEDKLHFCEACEPHKQEWCLNELAKQTQDYDKFYQFVRYIATDYIELSHEKVRIQRDDYVRMARALLKEAQDYDEV